MVVRIVNPVPSTARESESQGNRMALQNIRSRLAVLYGNKASLDTDASGETFVTLLRFPKVAQPV